MEYLVNESPSILIEKETGKAYPFSAEEEVFVVINSSSKQMISFDFEKRKLSARCIVRLIDYDKGAISEVSAVTPKFNIKSTFAPKPYGDSDITFLGGGFTASAVSRNGRIGIIASVPEIKLPSGGKGLKIEAFLTNDEKDKSFNFLLSYDKKTESLHASIAKEISGTIWIGEEKTEIIGDNLQGRHIWKRTSFPKRKEKPVGDYIGDDMRDAVVPTEQYVYDGCWLDTGGMASEQALLIAAQREVLSAIAAYDASDSVNAFILDGQRGWLDKDTRMGLRQNIADRKLGGLSNIIIWVNGKPHSMTLERAENFLRKVEDYAYTCKAVTYQHKVNVKNLTTLNDILQYNYTKDYPTIIIDKIA